MQHTNNDKSSVNPGAMVQEYIELGSASSNRLDSGRVDSPTPLASTKPNEGGEAEQPHTLPFWQAVKLYPKVVGYCLALTVAVIGWGYDLAIVGAVPGVDSFKNDYGVMHNGKMIIPGVWLGLFLGLPPAGSALGSVTAGELQDRIGRRFSLMVGSIVSGIAVSLIFFSHLAPDAASKRTMFTAGITLQGYSVGIIKVVCLTYVSENAPTAIRGSAMAIFPTFNLLGQLIGVIVLFIVNDLGTTGYLGAFGSQWVLSLAPFIISCIMPESPAYYVRKDDNVRAQRSAKRLFAPRVDPEVMLKEIREVIEEEMALTAGIGWKMCFDPHNLRRTMIVILANLIPTFFGLDLLANASVFLQTMGVDSDVSLLMLIVGIVCGMLGNGAGMWMLTKVGRRPATLWTTALAGALWGVLGVMGFWQNEVLGYASAGIIIAIVVVVALGAWPASYAIAGEASALRMRSKTQAVGAVLAQISSVVMGLILPLIFSEDQGDLRGKTGLVYVGLCGVGLVLSWLYIPEMKDRSALEIDHMFELKLPARQFRHWRAEGHEEVVVVGQE
jgi:MFS family permease